LSSIDSFRPDENRTRGEEMSPWRSHSGGHTRVKICCIASIDEAWLAINHGASALGFVSRMPSGPGPIEETLITDIVMRIPAGIATFLLTCETTAEPIIAQQRRTRVNTLQLVDAVEPDTYERLRAALPGVSIVQVIHVTGRASVDEAIALAPKVDALLLDSGNPSLAVKELGGTGRVHDWSLSKEIRDRASVPIYLAGGLNPSNAADAIRSVRPFALDVCSGLRTSGNLDAAKVDAFMRAVRSTS
jgi:phosphoribosylanthranilate isomerase